MSGLDDLSCPTIERWEKAGASLMTALKDYVDLCANLATDSLRAGAKPKYLISKIDATLATAHTAMSRDLSESTSALARTRNGLASPFSQFPEEVLCEIFLNVVYDHHNAHAPKYLTIREEVWLIYRHLYGLLGVCSTWRDIIMARGVFWSVIPVFSAPYGTKWRPFEFSLKRAAGSALHLATEVDTPYAPVAVDSLIQEHGPRFRTINISMDDERKIEEFISTLLERHTPGSLSELSIRFTQMRDRIDRPPLAFDYILTHDPSQQELFAGLVRDLVAFRINNVLLRWDTLTFSTRLVELRIQQVTLGYDDAIIPFLRALSSASNLRDLEIVSVSTIYNPVTHIQPLSPPIKLPALRFLFMKDLYLNTLERLLSAIAPGPYRSTLFLSLGNLDINFLDGEPPDDEPEEFEETSYLCKILKHTEIDTLMISGLLDGGWLTDSELVNILKAVPTLKTLKLDTWILGDELCNDLTRRKNARAPGGDRPLPALQNLHLTAVDIRSRKFFKDMVSSYPLKRFILGGQVLIDGVSGWKPLQEDSTVVQWLRSNMLDLDLRLVEKDYRPPEFHSSGWKLW